MLAHTALLAAQRHRMSAAAPETPLTSGTTSAPYISRSAFTVSATAVSGPMMSSASAYLQAAP